MKIIKALCIAICALSLVSCDKISETLKGTKWESSSYSTYLKSIEFTSETGTGMAVVSGDRRAPHILAYIDNIKVQRY